MSKDLHKQPFDEGTKVKLQIFRDYLKEWLPVFLAKKEIYYPTINIFEFFAGPGQDVEGFSGTPLIIVEELMAYHTIIVHKKLRVNLYLNEFTKWKFQQLEQKISEIKSTNPPFEIKLESLDFLDAFRNCYSQMSQPKVANLIFLDQSGIKHINEDIFKLLVNLKRTDFLFFISSSTFKRFADLPQIQQYFNVTSEEFDRIDYYNVHRKILNYYKNLIPEQVTYYLAPFSIKKPRGLYGLIFGSGHIFGIEKFLKTCWKVDTERGEANFDIDDDRIQKNQPDLFTGEIKKAKKVEIFELDLKEKIISKDILTDKDVYLYTITNGFIPIHSRHVLTQLILEKRLFNDKYNISKDIMKSGATTTQLKLQ